MLKRFQSIVAIHLAAIQFHIHILDPKRFSLSPIQLFSTHKILFFFWIVE